VERHVEFVERRGVVRGFGDAVDRLAHPVVRPAGGGGRGRVDVGEIPRRGVTDLPDGQLARFERHVALPGGNLEPPRVVRGALPEPRPDTLELFRREEAADVGTDEIGGGLAASA
jgi:hypothetical protein